MHPRDEEPIQPDAPGSFQEINDSRLNNRYTLTISHRDNGSEQHRHTSLLRVWLRLRGLESRDVSDERLGSFFHTSWINVTVGGWKVAFACDEYEGD